MILSIESSCDDSSVALTRIRDKKLVFHKKISQELDHAPYGGVVPELASRLHAVTLPKILEEARAYLPQIKAVAVTNEPGLSVTLLEGVAMAQALCLSLRVPLIAVNHLKAHIYSLFIEKETIFPMLVLLISGGHTQVLSVKGYDAIEIIASTIDDSFGESFDKTAKMLGLGYPGGPVVEALAGRGDAKRFAMPIPLRHSPRIAFSYSGLKNAVRLTVEQSSPLDEKARYDIAAAFQQAAIAHLMQKTKKIFMREQPTAFAIVGGASANLAVRAAFAELCTAHDAHLLLAPLEYCSDNAAMVGRCAIDAYAKGRFTDPLKLQVRPRVTCFAG